MLPLLDASQKNRDECEVRDNKQKMSDDEYLGFKKYRDRRSIAATEHWSVRDGAVVPVNRGIAVQRNPTMNAYRKQSACTNMWARPEYPDVRPK